MLITRQSCPTYAALRIFSRGVFNFVSGSFKLADLVVSHRAHRSCCITEPNKVGVSTGLVEFLHCWGVSPVKERAAQNGVGGKHFARQLRRHSDDHN